MLKNFPSFNKKLFTCLWITILITLAQSLNAYAASKACSGQFPNPITDICWSCLFPLIIGEIDVSDAEQKDNGDAHPPLICKCPAPPPLFFRFGVGMSFWEPARIAEVVRTPLCSPTLGGLVLANVPVPAGTHEGSEDKQEKAFYHVHWFQYPVLSWVGMALTSTSCLTMEPFDLAYFSEADPTWDDDSVGFLLAAESILFSLPHVQAACIADGVKAAVTRFGIDTLFWCSGSQGSVYPLSGSHANHVGGVDSSLAIVHKHIFKMHRMLLGRDTSTDRAMCTTRLQPILRKKQYKQQMLHPVPNNTAAYGFGMPSTIWGAGKEFPYKGEDFSYLIWRKRKCCAL